MSPAAKGLAFGSRYRTVKSAVTPIAFSSGNTVSVELPRSFLYKAISCRLSGTISMTAAGTGVDAFEPPLGLISKIELIADGRKVLFSLAGRDAYRMTHFMRGFEPERIFPDSAAIQAGTGISAHFILDNQAVRFQSPVDSFFDPRPYEKIELRVTWGTIADVIDGGTGTVNAGTQLDVIVEQTTEGSDLILFNRLLTFDENIIAAASTNFIINVPRSGLLAGILFRTDTNLGPADTVISNYSIKSDNNFLHVDRLLANSLKAFNAAEYQLDVWNNTGIAGTGFANLVTTPQVGKWGKSPLGYAYLDLTEDGLISSALNTLDLNVLQLILDVNAPATTRLIRTTYIYYEPIVTA